MGAFGPVDGPSYQELAWELVEVFEELPVDALNGVLARNVPLETLRFISEVAGEFAEAQQVDEETRRRLPNLLLLGYLLRIVEDRILEDEEPR